MVPGVGGRCGAGDATRHPLLDGVVVVTPGVRSPDIALHAEDVFRGIGCAGLVHVELQRLRCRGVSSIEIKVVNEMRRRVSPSNVVPPQRGGVAGGRFQIELGRIPFQDRRAYFLQHGVVRSHSRTGWPRADIATHPARALINVPSAVVRGGLREHCSAAQKRDHNKKDYFSFPVQGQESFKWLAVQTPWPGEAYWLL